MKKSTKLQLVGGVVLLFNLWLIGRYNLGGIPVLLLTFGFAAGYEYLVVRPTSKQNKSSNSVAPEGHSRETSRPVAISHKRENGSVPDIPQMHANEHRIYGEIANELETGTQDKGLWTRLYAECGGDEAQTKVLYIKQRADQLVDAERRHQEQVVRERADETKRREQLKRQLDGLADPELLSAVWNGDWNTASKLLRDGVKPVGIDEDGNSLLDLARKRRDRQMIQLLESYGAP